jgi:hypothetical protein
LGLPNLQLQQCSLPPARPPAHPCRAECFHGDGSTTSIAEWGEVEWRERWQQLEVLVMTPEVLLHVLMHGFMKVGGWVAWHGRQQQHP